MKIDEITSWEAFITVANKGNFTRAAEALGIPVPQVSKRVAKLESHLNVRLFQRTTRSVSLTDEGKALYPKINSIIEDLKEAESFFECKGNLSGSVKLTCVPFIAHKLLLPVIDDFLKLHPKIHIDLELGEKFTNIIDSGFDMAIRIETPKDSELIYKKLIPNDLIFCASPKYLKNSKQLNTLEDLSNHDLLMLSIHNRCHFINTCKKLRDFAKNKKLTCEDGVFLTNMALAGMGVLVRSIWDVKEHLEDGRLVQVLDKFPLETFGHVHAVIPSKRYLAPRVRAFLDFVVERAKDWSL